MRMRREAFLFVLLLCFRVAGSQQLPVSIQVDASKAVGDMVPFWSYFGYDEPNYTTRKDGRKLLTELTQLGPARFT